MTSMVNTNLLPVTHRNHRKHMWNYQNRYWASK